MTGLEEDQEFDFDFLFEFNQSDEGAGVAPGGSARVGGAEPKVQGTRAAGSGCTGQGLWVWGALSRVLGCRPGVQGLDVESLGMQVRVMQGSWVEALGIQESAGGVRSGRARLGHSLGPEQPLPVSLLLCPLVPDPCPGQGSTIVSPLPVRCPGPCGAGGKQVRFNGEWRVGLRETL